MLYEPNNALIAEQMAARQAAAAAMRAETVQLNPREEYGRLTQSSDYLRRHAQAGAFVDVLSGIVSNFQAVRTEQERVYRQERCE